MKELAKKFIEKKCLVCFEGDTQCRGVIKEVTDGAILLENDQKLEVLNLNYIICIKEDLW